MSCLFYDYLVKIPSKTQQICSAWCETKPVLAVALTNREILFFDDEGNLATDGKYTRNHQIMKMIWQPRGSLLAIGWKDGMISIWNHNDGNGRDINSPHKSSIRLIKWATTGHRLITSDDDGLLVVWKVDPRGQLSICSRYRRQGAITQAVFCTTPEQREKERKSETFSQYICPSFFFGGENGTVHYADDLDHISDVQNLNQSIEFMLFYELKSRLVIITKSLQLVQLQIALDGSVKPMMRVKLSIAGDIGVINAIWVDIGLVATASCESFIRFWDLSNDENSFLSLSSAGPSINQTDRINYIDFHPGKRMLAAGTKEGKIIIWKKNYLNHSFKKHKIKEGNDNNNNNNNNQLWEYITCMNVNGSIESLGWNPFLTSIYINTDTNIYTLNEAMLHRSIDNNIGTIQISPRLICIEKRLENNNNIIHMNIETSIRIKGYTQEGSIIAVWNGMKVEIYDIKDTIKRISQFSCLSNSICIRSDSIYKTNGNYSIDICNFQGNIKSNITFTETEGKPILLDCKKKYLTVCTDRGIIRVFDLARRDPKPIGSIGNIQDSKLITLEKAIIRSISINSDGTRVSLLADDVEGALQLRNPHTKLYIYNVEQNNFQEYDFGLYCYPISHYWDTIEPRLISCETYRDKMYMDDMKIKDSINDNELQIEEKDKSLTNYMKGYDKEIIILFASFDLGLLIQDSFPLDKKYESLLGIQVPKIYLIGKQDKEIINDMTNICYIETKIMRDFIGLDKVDDITKNALIDFSYYMTIGNMDEAYRSVKLIESISVWENMAHMCVKTKRLDVAEVCLGHMGHARGIAAVRIAKEEPEIEVPIAMVAIQLGLLDDAIRLYKECNRYDLLCKLYQSIGNWNKAIEIAKEKDRIHLKNIHYNYGKYLEITNNIQEAIKQYELANMEHIDVPRLLLQQENSLYNLQDYINNKTKNKKLIQWYAQYLESQDKLDDAIIYYRKAQDYLSLVRIYCYKKEYDIAIEITQDTGSKVAAYHLGRQFESIDNIQESIRFYAMSGSYNHAIRLSKENELDAELMNFALRSHKPNQMIECGIYFEEKNDYDKAVQLYRKAGNIIKALEICFKGNLFDELQQIIQIIQLNHMISPTLINRCADFFMKNKYYDKALDLYIISKKINDAIDICLKYNIKITEELAEKLTIDKDNATNKNIEYKREDLLRKLAKCCKKQGAYHLATKKYTQSGDKLKAMKCLLKSGDTEKIIFFTNVSRHKDIYILAANYLQNLNWYNELDIMKNIIQFYIKAKSFEQLIQFYETYAQIEIDEYKNYDKSIIHLKEALVFCSKMNNNNNIIESNKIQLKIDNIEKFILAKSLYDKDIIKSIKIIKELINYPNIENYIQLGDAYTLLVDYFYKNNNFDEIINILNEMTDKRIPYQSFIDTKIIQYLQKNNMIHNQQNNHKTINKNINQDNNNNNNNNINNNYKEKDTQIDNDDDIEEDIGDDEIDKKYRK